MSVIGVIIAGIIIGLLGKFVAPGTRDNTPLWLTILCGIGGVLIGWYLYSAFGGHPTHGIDWIRWLISIAVAAVLVVERLMAVMADIDRPSSLVKGLP